MLYRYEYFDEFVATLESGVKIVRSHNRQDLHKHPEDNFHYWEKKGSEGDPRFPKWWESEENEEIYNKAYDKLVYPAFNKYKYYVSTTRNPYNISSDAVWSHVLITLNRSKLQQKYKIIPVAYRYGGRNNELEDRIVTNNARMSDFPSYIECISVLVNPHHLDDKGQLHQQASEKKLDDVDKGIDDDRYLSLSEISHLAKALHHNKLNIPTYVYEDANSYKMQVPSKAIPLLQWTDRYIRRDSMFWDA